MIDTDKYENMRLLFLDFIDTASDEVDEGAWRDKLTMLDDLLAEVKRLRDLHILACDYLQDISDGTLPDSEWPHIHAMIRGDEE